MVFNVHPFQSRLVIVSDGIASVRNVGICDDGSDESLESPKMVQEAALNEIGRLEEISPVNMQVLLK